MAGVAAIALCCCIAVFFFCARRVLKHPDDPAPSWFGYVCGTTAIVGMISIAVLVTSVGFGLLRREEKKDCDHLAG